MDFIDEIAGGIGEIKGRYGRSLDPQKIIKLLRKEAKRNSKRWGDGKKPEAPNCFTVRIASDDWRRYYGVRKEAMEGRLARELYMSLSPDGLSMAGYPVVELSEDEGVMFGDAEVDAVFGEVAPYPEDIAERMHIVESMRTREIGGDDQDQDVCHSDAIDGGGPHAPFFPIAAKTDIMPGGLAAERLRQQVGENGDVSAMLSGKGLELKVFPGDVIGLLRRPHDRHPDIKLPGDMFPSASQNQAVFLFDEEAGMWSYENHSSNATVIVLPDGSRREVGKGDECDLADGSVLTIAEGLPLVFSC